MVNPIHTESQLEYLLSQPSEADVEAISRMQGDLLVLGAGGKMGPSLVRRARRAADLAGKEMQVMAPARSTVDLTDRAQVDGLPGAGAMDGWMAGADQAGAGRQRRPHVLAAVA